MLLIRLAAREGVPYLSGYDRWFLLPKQQVHRRIPECCTTFKRSYRSSRCASTNVFMLLDVFLLEWTCFFGHSMGLSAFLTIRENQMCLVGTIFLVVSTSTGSPSSSRLTCFLVACPSVLLFNPATTSSSWRISPTKIASLRFFLTTCVEFVVPWLSYRCNTLIPGSYSCFFRRPSAMCPLFPQFVQYLCCFSGQ